MKTVMRILAEVQRQRFLPDEFLRDYPGLRCHGLYDKRILGEPLRKNRFSGGNGHPFPAAHPAPPAKPPPFDTLLVRPVIRLRA